MFDYLRCFLRIGCCTAGCLAVFAAQGENAKTPEPATRHELWVPTKDLATILKEHPNAVLLSRAEYETLVRDAGKLKPEDKEEPPVSSVVEGVRLDLDIPVSANFIRLTAKVTVSQFISGWAEVKLLPVPDKVKLWKADSKDLGLQGSQEQVLALHGRGRHDVELQYQIPVMREHGICRAEIPLLARPVSVSIRPGERVVLPSRWPVRNGVAEAPLAAEKTTGNSISIYWLEASADGTPAKPTLFELANCLSTLDGVQVTTTVDLNVQSSHGMLPEMLQFRLPDDAVHVVSVDEKYIASWNQKGQVLEIHRTSGLTVSRSFHIVLTRPAPNADGISPLTIDVPRLEGTPRVTANVALVVGKGFEATGWQNQGLPVEGAGHNAIKELAKPNQLGSYASVHYDVTPDKVIANVRRLADRYSADVDTRIKVGSHEVTIARVLAFQGNEGNSQRAQFTLPDGEQFLELTILFGEAAEWKQTGANSFEINWQQGLPAGRTTSLLLQTRQEISASASTGKSVDKLTFGNIRVPEATRLAGYVSLAFDDSWKANTTATDGLEPRDAETTPVKGRMAWFTLRDYKLALELSRNETVLDAEVIAYALPRARNVEIEGQFGLMAERAPLREFDVKLPVKVAPLLRLNSPLIASQQLNDATGVWHLVLRKELQGRQNIRWHLSLPSANPGAPASGSQSVLSATLPVIALPGARHFFGQWVLEANTDTELTVQQATGVQPLDSLHPPAIEDYQPRHRVLAIYGYGPGDYTLALTAIRHDPSVLVSALVDQFNLASALSSDGSSKHEADLQVRHNGLQFFTLHLPQGAHLLAARVNNETIKPVRAGPDEVRVPLAARAGEIATVAVSILYELPGEKLGATGQRKLLPPSVDATVPVLTSQWKVFAPEGLEFSTEGGFAEASIHPIPPTFLRGMGNWLVAWMPNFSVGFSYANVPKEKAGALKQREQLQKDAVFTNLPPAAAPPQQPAGPGTSYYMNKMQRIIFPVVQFQGASVEEAVEFLRIKSRELDIHEPDPAKRGVNLIIRPGSAPSSASITLDLHEVPMVEALRYITELANMKYKVEPYAVVVVPPTDTNTEQFTRTFRVPPDFMSINSETVAPAITAKQILEGAGIPFPEGATATYVPATSQIVVKNTQPNLDAIEAFVEPLSAKRHATYGKAGLISLDLELPTNGKVLNLQSHEKPAPLVLTYQSWEHQMRKAILWMAMGAVLFGIWGRRRPCLLTVGVILLLTFGPQIWFSSWQAVANAILAGWLMVFACWIIIRIARWIDNKCAKLRRSGKGTLQTIAN